MSAGSIASVLLLGVGLPLAGQVSVEAPLRLTLLEAQERALANAPRLLQLRALKEAAQAASRQARGARLPQVDVAGAYQRNSNVPELTLTLPGLGPSTLFPNLPDNWRLHAGASLPLFTGGRLKAAQRSAESREQAAASDERTGSSELKLETTTAYWALVTSREAERVLRVAQASYDQHLEDARNREALGLAARSEVLGVTAERERAELGRLQAEIGAAVAEANLQRLLGLSAEVRIDPADELVAVAGAEEPTGPLVAQALAARSELAALRARLLAAEAAERVQASTRLPQASLLAGYDYANPNTRIFPLQGEWRGTWSAGISVGWSVFDGGQRSAAVAEAHAQAEALRLQLKDAEQRVGLEITTRNLEGQAAARAVAVSLRAHEAALEGRRVTHDRYREGVASSSELLDAETLALRAGLDLAASLSAQRLTQALLERALGR